ncbi:MAG: collagen binding domain-containing protein [Flavonifractor plautii]
MDCDDDQRGSRHFRSDPLGTYRIQEITAPAGWKLDDTVYTATVVAGETTTIPIINEELPGLRIIKYDRKIWSPCPMSPSPSIGTANF